MTQPAKKLKKKRKDKVTHFLEMEYGVSWRTGIVHDGYRTVRTKTYDVNQHHFIADMSDDTEVYVEAVTEDGQEFYFQYTKKTDPVYALKDESGQALL
eukprot:6367869-Amphidinium_carterae.1